MDVVGFIIWTNKRRKRNRKKEILAIQFGCGSFIFLHIICIFNGVTGLQECNGHTRTHDGMDFFKISDYILCMDFEF